MCGACKRGGLRGFGVASVGGGWTHYDSTIMPTLGRSRSLSGLRDVSTKQPMDPLIRTVLIIGVVAVGLVALAKQAVS